MALIQAFPTHLAQQAEVVEKLGKIPGVKRVETQTMTLMNV